MEGREAFEKGEERIFFLSQSDIRYWIKLDYIFWMAGEWSKGTVRAIKVSQRIYIVKCENVQQRIEIIEDEVDALLYGSLDDPSPKGIGFYNPKHLLFEVALAQTYQKMKEEFLANEEYELLDALKKQMEIKI